jgi:hypothetical protein
MPSDDNSPISASDESRERDLNIHRSEEQRGARDQAIARLHARGIEVDADTPMETVGDLLEAVEAFERAVEAHGGDLMIDTPPARQPDDPRFVLPTRNADESLASLERRIRSASQRLRDEL